METGVKLVYYLRIFWIVASPIKFRDFKTYLDKGYNAYGYARGGMLQDIKNLGRKTETLCHYYLPFTSIPAQPFGLSS